MARVEEAADAPRSAPRILGRYVLYEPIAAGGMATVHFGRFIGPGGFSRTVAIKKLHAQYARDHEFVRMFLDEARLAARIRHPNVVPTLEVLTIGGELLLVLEYVHCETLARLLQRTADRGEIVSSRIIASVMTDVLHGLHAAHEARSERGEALEIVHRDVSPQNVVVGIDGVARVLDFGIAKAIGRLSTTRGGLVKGKFAYMAPEQVRGAATRKSDLFSAAIVLWEALTARRLFTGEHDAAVIDRVCSLPVVPPSQLVPGLPIAFDEVVRRGLERDPEKRFQTAREMALALEGCGLHAPASEVGAWVEQVAADALARRLHVLSEIESASATANTSLSGLLGAAASRPSGIPTVPDHAAPKSKEHAPPEPDGRSAAQPGLHLIDATRSTMTAAANAPSAKPSHAPWFARRAVAGSILGFVAGACLVGAIVWRGRVERAPMTATPPIQPAPPSASSGSSPEPSSVAPVAPAVAVSASVGLPAQHAPLLRSGASRPAKHPSCDPPYSLDADGHVHFKPECVR